MPSALPPRRGQRAGQQRQPGQRARQHHRQVVPKRRFVLGISVGETLDMLHPEEVVPEIPLLPRDRQRPGGANHHRCRDGQHSPAQQFAEATLPDGPGRDRQHRHRQRQKALGHKAHGAGDAEQQIAAQPLPRAARLGRQPVAAHRRHQPQQQNGIEHRVGADAVYQQRGKKNHAAAERNGAAGEHPHAEPVEQQRAQRGAENGARAHAEQGMAEQQLADVVDPVAGDRFFKVAQAEKVRHHPAAARHHFAADLGVAGLIRLPQAAELNWNQVIEGEKRQQQRRFRPCAHRCPHKRSVLS